MESCTESKARQADREGSSEAATDDVIGYEPHLQRSIFCGSSWTRGCARLRTGLLWIAPLGLRRRRLRRTNGWCGRVA